VVLVVGTVGLLSMGSGADDGGGVVIDAGDAVLGAAGGYTTPGAGDGAGGLASSMAPAVSSTTTEAPRIWVQVAGAVCRPGVYHLAAGTRVFQAVVEAGGFAEDADEQVVALAAQLSDGCRVYVPKVGETPAGAVLGPTEASGGITGGAARGAQTGPVLLNTATAEDLDTLPGIGPALAQQIIAYREARGPFISVDQLTDVPGIGPAKLEQLRPLVAL
jgi:competence protein ComEA